MKKSLILTLLFLLFLTSSYTYSQTIAMDFTQDECGGASHHLYGELDAGKVIILEYIMLNCAPCIVATNALQTMIVPYENTHPGRVSIYSFGFLNSYTCEQILAWKTNNEYSHPVFEKGEEQVSYYGGMGMPTIVVVGTNEHKVFYKGIGYDPSYDELILAAIDSALLYNPTGVDEKIAGQPFRVYPTVFSDRLTVEVSHEISGAVIVLTDSFGREVFSSAIPQHGILNVPASGFARGIYYARIRYRDEISKGVKLIRQ